MLSRTCTVEQIAGHDGLSSKGSPAYMQISCRLSSPQRGQVVSSTICSAVEGAIHEVDIVFAGAHQASMQMQREEGPESRPEKTRVEIR